MKFEVHSCRNVADAWTDRQTDRQTPLYCGSVSLYPNVPENCRGFVGGGGIWLYIDKLN